jgi:hypothetical protein
LSEVWGLSSEVLENRNLLAPRVLTAVGNDFPTLQ